MGTSSAFKNKRIAMTGTRGAFGAALNKSSWNPMVCLELQHFDTEWTSLTSQSQQMA